MFKWATRRPSQLGTGQEFIAGNGGRVCVIGRKPGGSQLLACCGRRHRRHQIPFGQKPSVVILETSLSRI